MTQDKASKALEHAAAASYRARAARNALDALCGLLDDSAPRGEDAPRPIDSDTFAVFAQGIAEEMEKAAREADAARTLLASVEGGA